MSFILCLISNPANPAVDDQLAGEVQAAFKLGAPTVLDPGVAAEWPVAAIEEARVRALIGDRPVDVAVLAATQGRRKRLLVADMDSTMIDQECIDELADMIGVKDRVAAITARAMNGEIAFEPALRERVALLEGLSTDVIGHVIETRITLAAGGRTLVATMAAHGARTALVSGGFTAFTSRIAASMGFDIHRANTLLHANGKLTGKVAEPILGQQAKVDALMEFSVEIGSTPDDALAVGDGANDLGMIAIAGMGVALHAKPSVAAEAPIRISHGDLTALLYLQGYRRSDFADPR